MAYEKAENIRGEVLAQFERAGPLTAIFSRKGRGSRQLRRAVMTWPLAVAGRTGSLEFQLAASGGGIARFAACLRTGYGAWAEQRDGGQSRANDLSNPAHDLRNLFGQTPPRPGAMIPSGSIASFNCSWKRRSMWLLKL